MKEGHRFQDNSIDQTRCSVDMSNRCFNASHQQRFLVEGLRSRRARPGHSSTISNKALHRLESAESHQSTTAMAVGGLTISSNVPSGNLPVLSGG